RRRQDAIDRAKVRAAQRAEARRAKQEQLRASRRQQDPAPAEASSAASAEHDGRPLFEPDRDEAAAQSELDDIPIRTLEYASYPAETGPRSATSSREPEAAETSPRGRERDRKPPPPDRPRNAEYQLPPTSLLNEPPPRNPFDTAELKKTAGLIKTRLEEFN